MEGTVPGNVGDSAPKLVERKKASRRVLGCATTQHLRMAAGAALTGWEKTVKQSSANHQ